MVLGKSREIVVGWEKGMRHYWDEENMLECIGTRKSFEVVLQCGRDMRLYWDGINVCGCVVVRKGMILCWE